MTDYFTDKYLGISKQPPQAIDLEEAVLGAAMLEREAQVVALEMLTPDDFYLEKHQEVFAAMSRLATQGNPIDMRTIVHELRKAGKLELVGGPILMADLTNKVSSTANIKFHSLILIENRIRRNLIQLAGQIFTQAYEHTDDVFKLLDEVKAFPLKILDKIHAGQEKHIKQGIIFLANEINKREADTPEISGIPSGYYSIDRLTLGWRAPDLIVIAARPSMGKTTFVVNCIRNASIDFKIPIALFSLEMSFQQLVHKFVSNETDIELKTLTSRAFTEADWHRFYNKTNQLCEAPIYIDDTAAISISDLRIRCRRFVEKYGVRMIVVDYIQLMTGDQNSRGNREQEISTISRGLKQVAKELNVPVIALSQLSRKVDERPTKIPVLADLRESGAIEQDADIVAFLWRPAYYKITGDDGGEYVDGLTKVIFAKHRNGALGEPSIAFKGKTSKFISIDSPYYKEASAEKPKEAEKAPVPIPNPDDRIESKRDDDDLPF